MYKITLLPGKDGTTVKKLLAVIVIGGLFSLGCTDTGTKTEPKKDSMGLKKKAMEESKDEAKRPDLGRSKDQSDKKDTKKDDAAPKKDDAAPKKDDAAPKKDADKKDKDKDKN
jgi:hypothetical protein